MLKATLRSFENVDTGAYLQVNAFLKMKSSGFQSKKAAVFAEEGIIKFIDTAEDLAWLDVKVKRIF